VSIAEGGGDEEEEEEEEEWRRGKVAGGEGEERDRVDQQDAHSRLPARSSTGAVHNKQKYCAVSAGPRPRVSLWAEMEVGEP
jgi:hypothetical protein